MISIKIETQKGVLVEFPLEEAEKVYHALRLLFEKSGRDPAEKRIPIFPYPGVPYYEYPAITCSGYSKDGC